MVNAPADNSHKQRRRAIALALCLAAFVLLVFAMTFVRVKGQLDTFRAEKMSSVVTEAISRVGSV